MSNFRILVTGGRDYADAGQVESVLSGVLEELVATGLGPSQVVLVHGAASGLDRLAAAAAHRLGLQVEAHPADWAGPCRPSCQSPSGPSPSDQSPSGPSHRRRRQDGTDYCPAAGAYRNDDMVALGADLALVFPGGRGTADCARRIRAAGIEMRAVGGIAA